MSIYKQYCNEIVDENGRLQKLTLEYPDNFNFGYDVVDKIADETPEKRALVWCTQGMRPASFLNHSTGSYPPTFTQCVSSVKPISFDAKASVR